MGDDNLNLGSSGNAAPMTSLNGPGRSLGSAFQPSLARPVLCMYSVRITSGGAGSRARVELRSDNVANPPVTVQQQVVSGDFSGTSGGVLVWLCPPGWRVNLVVVNEAGAPTVTLDRQTETTL